MPGKTVILITGGNSGIGYATATALAASPKYHVIIGSRSKEKGQIALSQLSRDAQASVSLVQLDVTDAKSVGSAVALVEREHSQLDTLVNNAAIGPTTSSLSAEILRQVFETNVFGVATITESFLPLLRKSSDPRIIHVTSGLGSMGVKTSGMPTPPFYAYMMSKAALNMMALCNTEQFGDEIKVLTLTPGFALTNLGGNPEALKSQGAEDPSISGRFIKSVIEGERDSDKGKLIQANGIFPW